MKSSYKQRIAWRLTWVTALIISAVFVLIYMVADFTLIRNIDRELQLETEKHKDQIFLVRGEIRFLHKDEWEEMEHTQLQLNPIFIEIVDLNGVSMDRSPNLGSQHLLFAPEKAQTQDAWTLKIGDQTVRQQQIPLINDGQTEGYLLVATSFQDADELLTNLRNVLFVLYPMILISLFLTMRYLAGKSMEPILEIISIANQINQKNLNERVPDSNLNDEIGQLTHSINRLLDRLEQALIREKQFTSDASHELRTPLSVLRGTLEVLIRKPRTAEEYQEKIQTALKSIDKMTSIIDQLLALARVESTGKLVHEEVELIAFVEELVDQKKLEFDRVIHFNSQVGFPIYVKTHEKSLKMILENLLQNAVKYSSSDTSVVVEVGMRSLEPYIQVIDQGCGIEEENLEKIFDPFFRTQDALQNPVPGTGLGLAIVKKLCQESGIKISVSSILSRGSVFRLDFPKQS